MTATPAKRRGDAILVVLQAIRAEREGRKAEARQYTEFEQAAAVVERLEDTGVVIFPDTIARKRAAEVARKAAIARHPAGKLSAVAGKVAA